MQFRRCAKVGIYIDLLRSKIVCSCCGYKIARSYHLLPVVKSSILKLIKYLIITYLLNLGFGNKRKQNGIHPLRYGMFFSVS
jgi:hypothetical protein